MAQIFPRNTASVSVGDIDVSIPNYTASELSEDYEELGNDSSKTVPTGAIRVTIWNTGLGNITVTYDSNVRTIRPGGNWKKEAFQDRSNQRTYKLKEVLVTVPNGPAASPNSASVSVERGA